MGLIRILCSYKCKVLDLCDWKNNQRIKGIKMVDRHFKEQLHRLTELCHDVKFSHIRREAILGDIALSLAMILDKLEEQEDEKS